MATLTSARFLTLLMGTFLPRSEQYDVSALNSKLNPDFGFDWCRIRYVVADRHGVMLFIRGACIEISVCTVTVWFTYRDEKLLKFSALAGAIITQATRYLFAIIGVQIYLKPPPQSPGARPASNVALAPPSSPTAATLSTPMSTVTPKVDATTLKARDVPPRSRGRIDHSKDPLPPCACSLFFTSYHLFT